MTVFEQLVAATGLGPLIAPFVVRRVLIRSDVLPAESVGLDDLPRTLPRFEETLRVYLGDDRLERAMDALRRLAESAAA